MKYSNYRWLFWAFVFAGFSLVVAIFFSPDQVTFSLSRETALSTALIGGFAGGIFGSVLNDIGR